jgi:hypothetical protein
MSSSHTGKPSGTGGQIRYKKPADTRWTSGAYDYVSLESELLDEDGYTKASKDRGDRFIEKRASLVNDLSQLFIDESSFYSR